MKLFAVRDKKAQYFLKPFFARNEGEASRSFVDACHDTQTPLAHHPEDYDLYLIGGFDDETGSLKPADEHPEAALPWTPVLVVTGLSTIPPEKA